MQRRRVPRTKNLSKTQHPMNGVLSCIAVAQRQEVQSIEGCTKGSQAQSNQARSQGDWTCDVLFGQGAHGTPLITRAKERPVNYVLEAQGWLPPIVAFSHTNHHKVAVRPKIGHTGSVTHKDNGSPSRTQPGWAAPEMPFLSSSSSPILFEAAFVLSILFAAGTMHAPHSTLDMLLTC
ncbi:hypothetical protein DE146DRAFT_260030 [Phaeosphaeria sp. MPI-PUGE-AT-0046c]|nr:hypothetical protein DE146DRAFT_260030 [Phaeosphaeria sp. MPI-PUGE-AT-0046c]